MVESLNYKYYYNNIMSNKLLSDNQKENIINHMKNNIYLTLVQYIEETNILIKIYIKNKKIYTNILIFEDTYLICKISEYNGQSLMGLCIIQIIEYNGCCNAMLSIDPINNNYIVRVTKEQDLIELKQSHDAYCLNSYGELNEICYNILFKFNNIKIDDITIQNIISFYKYFENYFGEYFDFNNNNDETNYKAIIQQIII